MTKLPPSNEIRIGYLAAITLGKWWAYLRERWAPPLKLRLGLTRTSDDDMFSLMV